MSKFCNVAIETKYSSSDWMLFEKQLWRHSLLHVTSHPVSKGAVLANRFSCVVSASFEILFRCKKHSIHLKNVNLNLTATDPNTI